MEMMDSKIIALGRLPSDGVADPVMKSDFLDANDKDEMNGRLLFTPGTPTLFGICTEMILTIMGNLERNDILNLRLVNKRLDSVSHKLINVDKPTNCLISNFDKTTLVVGELEAEHEVIAIRKKIQERGFNLKRLKVNWEDLWGLGSEGNHSFLQNGLKSLPNSIHDVSIRVRSADGILHAPASINGSFPWVRTLELEIFNMEDNVGQILEKISRIFPNLTNMEIVHFAQGRDIDILFKGIRSLVEEDKRAERRRTPITISVLVRTEADFDALLQPALQKSKLPRTRMEIYVDEESKVTKLAKVLDKFSAKLISLDIRRIMVVKRRNMTKIQLPSMKHLECLSIRHMSNILGLRRPAPSVLFRFSDADYKTSYPNLSHITVRAADFFDKPRQTFRFKTSSMLYEELLFKRKTGFQWRKWPRITEVHLDFPKSNKKRNMLYENFCFRLAIIFKNCKDRRLYSFR